MKDLVVAGGRWAVAGMRAIIKQVNDAVACWAEFATQAGINPGVVARIGGDLIPLR